MKLLIIGGTGNISWWCADLAAQRGIDTTIVTRGETIKTRRKAPRGVRQVKIDVNDLDALGAFTRGESFDVVTDFLAYSAESFPHRWAALTSATDKYVAISSTLIFARSEGTGIINDDSPRRPLGVNGYIDGKLGIEEFIVRDPDRYARSLILRPSHTFDTNVPTPLGSNCFTDIERLLAGKPLLVPGDGMGKWTIMHSSDFARAWLALIENETSFGKSINVVGDEVLTWNKMAEQILSKLSLGRGQIKRVPVEKIESLKILDMQTANSSNLGSNFALHRKWNDLYNAEGLRTLIPGWHCKTTYSEGFWETISWLMGDPDRIRINPSLRSALDELASA